MKQNSNALKFSIISAVVLFMINMLFVVMKINYAFDWSYIFVAGATIYFIILLYEELSLKYGGKNDTKQL